MKIALFGGSFNPPHIGHTRAIKKLAAMKEFDEVWVVPCASHPFQKDLAPFPARVLMLERALEGIRKVKILTIENNLKAPNRTINTIRALKKKFPQYEFSLIIGSDILNEIRSWKDYKKIEEAVEIIIITRKGFRVKECPYRMIKLDLPEISSTDIRRTLKEKKDTKDIPERIRDLAIKLYR